MKNIYKPLLFIVIILFFSSYVNAINITENWTMTGTANIPAYRLDGYQLKTNNQNVTLISVNKSSTSNASVFFLMSGISTYVGNYSFNGTTATVNANLTANTLYWLMMGTNDTYGWKLSYGSTANNGRTNALFNITNGYYAVNDYRSSPNFDYVASAENHQIMEVKVSNDTAIQPMINYNYNVSVIKTPYDLNSSVVGLIKFNASIINLTANNSINENSTATLFYNITSNLSTCVIYENLLCTDGNTKNITMDKITNYTFNTSISEYGVFPAYYPFYEKFVENSDHYNYSVYLNHNIMFIVQNFTTYTNPYISLEMDTENLSSTSNMGIYYCNSSYIDGYPLTDSNCELVQTIIDLSKFNKHTHSTKSSHYVFNINIQNIAKTKLSYFIIVSSQAQINNGYNVRYVLNDTYTNHSFKIGNYNSWANTSFIFDIHIHQFIPQDSLKWWTQFNDGTGNLNTSIVYTDYFNVINQIPTGNYIYKPNSTDKNTLTTSQNTTIEFKWTPSTDFENDTLTYNLSIRNTLGVLTNIGFFNQSILNYNWSTNKNYTSSGYYQGIIEVCDNNSNCVLGTTKDNFYLCENNYQKTLQPCINNAKIINYSDVNYCGQQFDIPLNNSFYESCITPATQGETNMTNALYFVGLALLIGVALFIKRNRGN